MKHDPILTGPGSAEGHLQPLAAGRLARAKRSFTTRRVALEGGLRLLTGTLRPRAGDLVLARVDSLGQHPRLEDPAGRRVALYPGDEIVVAYGNRYAPDQFEAMVPGDLGPCELVAAGGIAACVQRRSGKVRPATRISPVGLLADRNGCRISTLDHALPEPAPAVRPPVLAVVGSSMNAGKTTALAALAHGESRGGQRVGAIKVTGTGSGGDLWCYADAGAARVLDFTDAGHATTHRAGAEAIESILRTLVGHMAAEGVDLVLVEVADGLLLDETAGLVTSECFRSLVDGLVFAGADAMSALAGEAWARAAGLNIVALTGAMTASPLAVAEVSGRTSLPVLTLDDMLSGRQLARDLIERRASCAA